ncbi:MAG: pyridoxal phosphate-dependent aminotransferase [Desulfotomaculales bacterium]
MKLSGRARAISPSPTLAIDARAKEMKAQGIEVINFGVGEPDFDTPQHIKDAAVAALAAGMTKYTAVGGIKELKEAIAAKFQRDNGLSYTPDEIVVSVGAKHSLYNAIQVLCDEGDEVVIPAPYWVSYVEQVKLAGAVPRIVRTSLADGFKLTPEKLRAAVGPRTRVLILNTPCNPTGAVYGREELEALAEVALAAGLVIVSDEIYEKLVYEGNRHVSIASLAPEVKERTVVINGVSKAYAMTGWRIGYLGAPRDVARAITRLQSHSTSNPTSIAQAAALAALTGSQEPVREMVAAFARRRAYIVERLRALRGVACPTPEGAFYVFPDFSAYWGGAYRGRPVNSGTDLAQLLLEEAQVAVVPGIAFGDDNCIRFSYATSRDVIGEGLNRLARVLEELT